MDNSKLLIVIPAIKKSAIIPDQLIKKLDGITLIQRAINIAKNITNNILIITDSEEISLICERNNIQFYKDAQLKIDSNNIIDMVKSIVKIEQDILVYRANAPLVDEKILIQAYNKFLENKTNIIVSVKKLDKNLLKQGNNCLVIEDKELFYKELKAFLVFNFQSNNFFPFVIDEENSIEIESYQDWWVCEKLLQRKKIVFNVIGNLKIGMGHIYRALSLAHEITDHEIIFVCNENDKLAVSAIASKDYKVISSSNILKNILEIQPNLVINDILNTNKNFILTLKQNNIKVVNFEDLGEGVKYADLVFNELYDIPVLDYKNILWGKDWYFLRDEFENANQNKFRDNVKNILITFGGTDQHNLTLKTLKNITDSNIKIKVICGGGYLYRDELDVYVKKFSNIEVIYQTGAISKKMENVDFAITSNGRTVYELAHMHIPSIVISQHKREDTHKFSILENGFINLGVVTNDIEENIKNYVDKLLNDKEYRYLLYLNTTKFNFLPNKKKVLDKILELI